ncbi:MAG: protease [Streptosporangiaceae bacterium]|jgi:protease I|nr:protease [Streptosporangiaceae bacterium]
MGTALKSASVAFLAAAEGTEQSELQHPWDAVIAQGGHPVLISPAPEAIQMFEHLDRGDTMPVDVQAGTALVADFAGLVLPGGVANPDQLRTEPAAVAFARGFFDAGKPVAAICHAPWTLIEADVVGGRTLTSWPSLRTDIRNAGGTWVDEQVVVCSAGPNTLVTSRRPHDLPAFCDALVQVFGEAIG